MYQHRRDPNPIKKQKAETAIPDLTETLKVHSQLCELTIRDLIKKHSLQVTTLEGVEEHLTIELEDFNRQQSQGIMGRVPQI